jgi:SagB-type dehydrogenase family enzyme
MYFADAVLKRRSLRNFVPAVLSRDSLTSLLTILCKSESPSGGLGARQEQSVCVGLLSGDVEGLESGAYLLDQERRAIGLIRSGFFIGGMTKICLDQAWLGQCALHFFLVSNLEVLEKTWGPRGYRYAMMSAGRLGQRIYLGATAIGLGCCGIGAFYDREAAGFLGLNDSSAMLYLLGVGPVKKAP